jgi:hypothetical protein
MQRILAHNPRAWCTSVTLFKTAHSLFVDEQYLFEFLEKMPAISIIDDLESQTAKIWFEAQQHLGLLTCRSSQV